MQLPRIDGARVSPTRRATSVVALVAAGLTAGAASAPTAARATPGDAPLAPSQLAVHIYLPVSVRAATLAPGKTFTPGPPSTPGPEPTSGPAAGPLLNELMVVPPGSAPQFIELRAPSGATSRTADVRLEVVGGGSIVVPSAAPAVTAEEVVLILLDGGSGVEGRTIHAGPPGFLPVEGEIVLLAADGAEHDRVSWGREIGDVPLGAGGLLGLPPPGSVLARLGEGRASGADAWMTLEPLAASPGRANPPSTVQVVLPPDGSRLPPGTVGLSWYPAPAADGYRVQVATDADFTRLVAEGEVAAAKFVTGALPAGEYFWRVAVVQEGRTLAFGATTRLRLAGRPRAADDRGRALAGAPAQATATPIATPTDDPGAILDVPYLSQHKDTGMLLLESPQASGPHAWDVDHGDLDPDDPADNMNCALASIAMVAAYYGGDLSQDRLGFEHFKGRSAGPEQDLNYGNGLLLGEWVSLAAWALQTGVVVERRIGADGTATELSLDDMWATIVGEIDAGRPMFVRVPGHAMVGTGYDVESGERWVEVSDPWSVAGNENYYVAVGQLTHTVRTTGAPNPRSDEASVSADSDGDGIVDFDEAERFGTFVDDADSDHDDVPDGKDVFASVHDDWHGYAQGGDGRDDIDGDGSAPERDDDSDDGGCLDGLEDFNGDGVFQRVGNETSPFEKVDDRCISGRFLLDLRSDSTTESQIHHTEVRHEVTISLLEPKEDGTIEGAGVVDYFHYASDVIPGRCVSYIGPIELSWPVKLTGRFTDDVLSFEADPPSHTITITPTGTCGGDPFPYAVSHFPGWADITFTDGLYEYSAETPHNPPDTGRTRVEVTLRQKEPE